MTHAHHAYGPLVRTLRELHGWSLADLGAEAELDPGYLSRVERRDHNKRASAAATIKLAAALDVDVAVLTGAVPPFRTLRRMIGTWTDEQFADLISVSRPELEAYEQGTADPPEIVLLRMALRLGVPPDALRSHRTYTAGQIQGGSAPCPA